MIDTYRLSDEFSSALLQAYYSELNTYLSDWNITADELKVLTKNATDRYKEKLEKYRNEKIGINKDTKEFLDYLFVEEEYP